MPFSNLQKLTLLTNIYGGRKKHSSSNVFLWVTQYSLGAKSLSNDCDWLTVLQPLLLLCGMRKPAQTTLNVKVLVPELVSWILRQVELMTMSKGRQGSFLPPKAGISHSFHETCFRTELLETINVFIIKEDRQNSIRVISWLVELTPVSMGCSLLAVFKILDWLPSVLHTFLCSLWMDSIKASVLILLVWQWFPTFIWAFCHYVR